MKENTDNYFIFASDKRAYLDTINVVKELKKRGLNYFYLFSEESSTQFPHQDLSKFSYDTNVDIKNNIHYNSINCSLPFRPDVVILTRESWQPQQSIIHEFKTSGSIISCIENANWVIGTIKSRLEMISRFRYPTNCIDIFFENAQWSLDTKKICGWYDFKSVVVGNPKYDNIWPWDPIYCSSILVFGSMEKEAKLEVYKILDNLKQADRQIYYRPHPGEISDNPDLKIEGVEIIFNESDVPKIASKCNYHLGNIASSAYYSILFNKTFVSIDQNIRIEDFSLDFFKGKEYDFWAPIIGVNSWDEFVNKIGLNTIKKLKERLEEVRKDTILYDKDLNFLKKTSNPINSKYFDDFNDKKSSVRIVDYLVNIK
tara:strand:+ start:2162 stop:3274 length:1113 start_codon:yes stop_codon:yes gene_type:complete